MKNILLLQAFNSDETALAYLAAKLNGRKLGLRRCAIAKKVPHLKWRREWRDVAARWLRLYIRGNWYVGGHHVGRYNFGPAIGELKADRGPLVVIQ